MKVAWLVRLAFAVSIGWSAPLGARIPADCTVPELMAVDEANAALSERSAGIVSLGAKGDLTKLQSLVSPSAGFSVWEGDAEIRLGEDLGAAGAIQFAKRVRAKTFAYATIFPGPISTDLCANQRVTIWLIGPDGRRAYVAEFEFDSGLLMRAEARLGAVGKGDIQ
jgi:hypothetical protein